MYKLEILQTQLDYTFKDGDLLVLALTHRSKHKTKNNERLEFLGDAILSLIISTALFKQYDQIREGELSRLRAALVKGETIAKLATTLGISDYLRLGVGELKSGGHQRESILAGAFEAVIGAIYLDSDFQTTERCVLAWYADSLAHLDDLSDVKDAKTILQEITQAEKWPLPIYEFVASGHAHARQFQVICRIEGLPHHTTGKSSSRRKAEQIAAKLFLEKLSLTRRKP